MLPDYPEFDEAVVRFKRFLTTNGWPDQIEWIRLRDIVIVRGTPVVRLLAPGKGHKQARLAYEAAVHKRLGVEMFASFLLSDCTCAWVYGPTDEDEASRLLFPDGLKLSADVPQRRALSARGTLQWGWYSMRCTNWARSAGLRSR
jgi:hypothetical protein